MIILSTLQILENRHNANLVSILIARHVKMDL